MAMRYNVNLRDAAQARLDSLLTRGFTDMHRSVQGARSDLTSAQNAVTKYAKTWLERHGGIPPTLDTAQVGSVSPEALASMKTYRDLLIGQRKTLQEEAFRINDARRKIEGFNEEIKKKQGQLAAIDQRLTMLTTESPVSESAFASGRIRIIGPLDLPFRPSIDSRKKLAMAGVILGGGLPLGGFLLWGLLDRRYRYSDDAGTGRLHPTLLGILPYLPENMADPEQAAVAAHCVHQIRTLLQISGLHQDRRVFAITSPTAGDGKTSLSLSLGLSFAASGAETCLIDFDLIGGGLSSSMQVKNGPGLMDALEHGHLNGHIRASAFPRLSILPVGRDDAQEVSRLSPELVQRVIDEAKRRFDVVIIDTGPILGSIEANLISAAADGVILAVGRGQSRTQAERAIEHLASVGATLIGVVFNRADPADFRRAVSSASVRSVPMQGGHGRAGRALPAMGPMASTVATQIDTQEEEAPV
jgi:capsular exopolysaccharide synthesis family protein